MNEWDEVALVSGVGFSDSGQARSGMGVDAVDLHRRGWEDLFVANVDQEMFSLYENNKDETFSDVAHQHGIAQATRLLSGWGLKFFDFDDHGAVDLLLANGHPDDMVEIATTGVKYKEPLLLFLHDAGTLHNISSQAGPVFAKSFPARGLAIGDAGSCSEATTCNRSLRDHCRRPRFQRIAVTSRRFMAARS